MPIIPSSHRVARLATCLARCLVAASAAASAAASVSACWLWPRSAPPSPTAGEGAPAAGGGADATAATRRGAPAPGPDLSAVYRQMGLIGGTGDLPFVGRVAHFAAATRDSTHVLLTLSLSNRALAFAREGDRYRASYQVRLDVRRPAQPAASVRQVATDEVVRVATFKETARTDESVLFYQWLTLAPGSYTLSVAMRDAEGGRSSAYELSLEVPRLGPGALSTPLAVYDAVPRLRLDTLPRLAPTARAAITFGHDSLVPVYVEGYAAAPSDAGTLPLRVTARGERGVVVWTDTTSLPRRAPRAVGVVPGTPTASPPSPPAGGAASGLLLYGGVVRVPVARLGIGVVSLALDRLDAPGAVPDSARVSLFVTLGEDLPITSVDEVASYLRYYAAPERLRVLRDTAPEARALAWAAFLRDSDPLPATAEHEGLRDYFARIRAANVRFAEEGSAGWLTDRGMAYVGLGEPDQIFDPGGPDVNARGRQQIWDYRNPRLQLVFVDQSGFGRWRLTGQSMTEVQSAIRQRLVR